MMFYIEGIHKIYHPLKLDRFALWALNKSVVRVFVYEREETKVEKKKLMKIYIQTHRHTNTLNSIIVKTKGSLNIFIILVK